MTTKLNHPHSESKKKLLSVYSLSLLWQADIVPDNRIYYSIYFALSYVVINRIVNYVYKYSRKIKWYDKVDVCLFFRVGWKGLNFRESLVCIDGKLCGTLKKE